MEEDKAVTRAAIQSHFDAGDRFGFVGMFERLGFMSLMCHLEYEKYPPHNKELNNRFQLFIIDHQDIRFLLISVPLEDRHIAERYASQYGCKFADGVPTVFCGQGDPLFPIQHKHIWSVENTPGHAVYSPGFDLNAALEKERNEVDAWQLQTRNEWRKQGLID